MYPHERSLVEQYENQPFVIVGINSDPTAEFLRTVMKEKNLTWSSFFDGGGTGGPIATKWGVNGWPTVFVLDHEGVIRHTSRSNLDEVIARLVREVPTK
ncbi:MAG: TlpA family protein disulfide reductase [Phycisphaerales bacterium]|nr:TlpA family protein disulfide reductase [Phycisphaerales bacterium]